MVVVWLVTTHLGKMADADLWIESIFEDMVHESNIVEVASVIHSVCDQLSYLDTLRYSDKEIFDFLLGVVPQSCSFCGGSGRIFVGGVPVLCGRCQDRDLGCCAVRTTDIIKRHIEDRFLNGRWMKVMTKRQYSFVLKRIGSKSSVVPVDEKKLRDNRLAKYIDLKRVVASFSIL